MFKNKLTVVYDQKSHKAEAESFTKLNNFKDAEFLDDALANRRTDYFLHFADDGSYASWFDRPKKPVLLKVDFIKGANAHRRLFGGGKGQMIAKATGIQSKFKPSIFDATAGQGGDAFVFASLGCRVTMLERSPIAFELLRSALHQALVYSETADADLHRTLLNMDLHFEDSLKNLFLNKAVSSSWAEHDVVYLDPMFPERKKSAAVKKEMRIFHDLIGPDNDSDKLLDIAKHFAKYRVVVKRPKNAPFLMDEEPTYNITGKSTRFDIYVNKALPGT